MRRTRIPEKFIEASLPCAEAWGLDKKREARWGAVAPALKLGALTKSAKRVGWNKLKTLSEDAF